jgi:hypothetical protein
MKQANILTRSIGKEVNSNNGELLGSIAGFMRDSAGDELEYVILESEEFFGRGKRIFAVPAYSSFIDISEDEKIIFELNKDDLQFARGISADQCPEPNPKYGQSVFEIYNYHELSEPNSTTTLKNHKKTNIN